MTAKPKILLQKPEPQIKQRLYNGRRIMVWEGRVKVESIAGWVDNPRIELEKKKYLSKIGQRDLTQDEIFTLMKNDPDVKLKDLRDDIIKNGLREPLALSFSGKLLDGNRRFFAVKYALEGMPLTDPNRQDLEVVDVHVLTDDATEEDEQNVLVEENFSASLKIEWPDYVKARKVIDAHEDDGLSIDQLSQKFSWAKSKIRETLRIHEIISDFIVYSTSDIDPSDEHGGGLGFSEQDAETLAAKSYQFFNEAQKSFFDPLKSDIDFKFQFFKWIADSKFSSFPEVRIAFKAWQHPEAKSVLLQPDPLAAKSAKAILDYNSRVVQSADEAAARIETFVKFLKDLTAEEIQKIPDSTSKKLEEALSLMAKLSQAAKQ
jgi:hypothetical protein